MLSKGSNFGKCQILRKNKNIAMGTKNVGVVFRAVI
jgi:hypothetical protein